MHIVIDCRFINHSGLGRYIREIVSRLVKNTKNNFTLIISKNEVNYEFLKKCDENNVKYIYINAKMYSIKEQLELPFKIPKCDIFWAPHYNAPILLVRANKKIVTIHDMGHISVNEDLSFIKKLYAKILMYTSTHFYDKIFTVSNFSKTEIIKYEKIDSNKIHVYYCGVDLKKYTGKCYDMLNIIKKYDVPSKYFLYVGNVKPHKNILRLIEGFAKFSMDNEDIKLLIVGKKDGLLTGVKGLEELINKYDIKDKIIFTGFVDDEDLALLYNRAEAFIFPSLYEGFGIPPLEAMAFNCPVLSSNKASLPEIYGDSVLYIDPFSVEDIARGMKEIIKKEIKNNLILKGKKKINEYSWDNTAKEIENNIFRD